MKLTKKITGAVMATAMLGSLAVPTTASAEISANMGVASFYLWRGQDISAGAPEVSGGLDYGHESGAYAGIWTTSEAGGSETDVYFGYGAEAGDISYDISYWTYLYPSDNALPGGGDSTISELVLGLGFQDFSFGYYLGVDVDAPAPGADYSYITLGYAFGESSITYGMNSSDAAGSDFSHITYSYAPTDNFTFTVSKGLDDAEGIDEDLLFHVAYSLPLELK